MKADQTTFSRSFAAKAKALRVVQRVLNRVPTVCGAYGFARNYRDADQNVNTTVSPTTNRLWEYFRDHKEGNGIWKFEHYFDMYQRHFARFVDREVNVLEIGVYSGGSLEMWRSYFGERSHIYGVDIEQACETYENDYTSIFVGDQADRAFWKRFRDSAEGIDILIDDGGHTLEQQRVTLEEMLPSLRPGGVYLCEDLFGEFNGFSAFASGLVNSLNQWNALQDPPIESSVTTFQSSIHSIHFYPYAVVIEKHAVPCTLLTAPRHGTKWQPYL